MLPSTFVDETFTDDQLLEYMQEVADVVEETTEPESNQQPGLADFQFPELAADDAKIEVVKDIHKNLSMAVRWRRAHFRFASMLAHIYAVRNLMAAAFVAGVVHRSIFRFDGQSALKLVGLGITVDTTSVEQGPTPTKTILGDSS